MRVVRGDSAETGFVFGSSRHVVTSKHAVDAWGSLVVVSADGVAHDARVVAWSESSDLAVLELEAPLRAAPLPPALAPITAGQDVVIAYEPRDPEHPDARTWELPLAVIGHLARLAPGHLDIDVNTLGLIGELGAPVLTRDGAVVGMIVFNSRRATAVPVSRVASVLARRGVQGEYTRHLPPRGLGGPFLSVGRLNRGPNGAALFGAGVASRATFDWFSINFGFAFLGGGERIVGVDALESRTRIQLELGIDAQVMIAERIAVFAGPGVQGNVDTITTTVASTGPQDRSESTILNGGPALTVGTLAGGGLVRGVISRAPRIDLGFLF